MIKVSNLSKQITRYNSDKKIYNGNIIGVTKQENNMFWVTRYNNDVGKDDLIWKEYKTIYSFVQETNGKNKN